MDFGLEYVGCLQYAQQTAVATIQKGPCYQDEACTKRNCLDEVGAAMAAAVNHYDGFCSNPVDNPQKPIESRDRVLFQRDRRRRLARTFLR